MPKLLELYAASGYAGIGFYAPLEIRAAPRRKTVAAREAPQNAEHYLAVSVMRPGVA